ncbi:MAG: chemotaxis protein CheA [Alphaproteobacteria bacterium]|nr:chemotaxis protein CheA [Alphaproteobacteria bacterium]
MADLSEFKATFFLECQELLENMESGLMAMDAGEAATDHIDAIFRAVHSVKGGAGAFGFEELVEFAHIFETVLDRIRQGTVPATEAVVELLLRSGDILADFMAKAEAEEPVPDGFGAEARAELHALEMGGEGGDGDDDGPAPEDFEDLDFTPVTFDDDNDNDDDDKGKDNEDVAPEDFDGIDFSPITAVEMGHEIPYDSGFAVQFTPHPELFRRSNEPLLLFRELRRIGKVTVTADLSNIPDLTKMFADGGYVSWSIKVETDASIDAIHEVFEFVEDDCDLKIVPFEADPKVAPPKSAAPAPAPAPENPVAEINEPAKPAATKAAPVAAKPAKADAAKAEAKKEDGAGAPTTIRVDLDRVDRVVDMVGELVITQAMLRQIVGELPPEGNYAELWRGLEELFHISRELQESVMAIRAQPVGSIFQRMPRLVRELSAQTGKKAKLVMQGEGTEVDKTVTERLSDPLTHMIRNALDHGIETPEERMAAGKVAEGTVRLSAEHKGGRIVIELSDDGRGINRERVREKAIEKGLIQSDAVLTDEETDMLIFAPGFSTAASVSNLSGRGVGMDVVKRNVQDLGGRIGVKSAPGKGSSITLTLPLTLAVMDGMVVSLGTETYIMPISNIVECLRPQKGDIQRAGDGGDVLLLRGEIVPVLRLGTFFQVDDARPNLLDGVVVVVEVEGGAKLGLAVDDLLGQQQVVIKSIEENYGQIDGVGAATILGNGQVALILDVDAFGRLDRSSDQGRQLH